MLQLCAQAKQCTRLLGSFSYKSPSRTIVLTAATSSLSPAIGLRKRVSSCCKSDALSSARSVRRISNSCFSISSSLSRAIDIYTIKSIANIKLALLKWVVNTLTLKIDIPALKFGGDGKITIQRLFLTPLERHARRVFPIIFLTRAQMMLHRRLYKKWTGLAGVGTSSIPQQSAWFAAPPRRWGREFSRGLA